MKSRLHNIFVISLSVVGFLLPPTDVMAATVWQSFAGGAEDMEFGILSTIGGVNVAGPSALETGYNGAYAFPISGYMGWGQTFSVLTDRELSAVQLRISRFSANTPTGLIKVSVSEFNPSTSTLGATIASTSVSASNFDAPLGSDIPISTIDLSASGGQLDSAKTYLLSLESMGGFDGTAVAPYAATDIYPGGNSYYTYIPLPPAIYLFGTGLMGLIGISRRKKAA